MPTTVIWAQPASAITITLFNTLTRQSFHGKRWQTSAEPTDFPPEPTIAQINEDESARCSSSSSKVSWNRDKQPNTLRRSMKPFSNELEQYLNANTQLRGAFEKMEEKLFGYSSHFVRLKIIYIHRPSHYNFILLYYKTYQNCPINLVALALIYAEIWAFIQRAGWKLFKKKSNQTFRLNTNPHIEIR